MLLLGFVDDSTAFIDATHIKAAANNRKFIKKEAERTAKFYESALKEEINRDREEHDKKPLKDKDDNDGNSSSRKPEKTV